MTTAAPPETRTTLAQLKGVADETRLAILLQLRHGEQCVCDLTDTIQASQSLLSFHLRILREAGLVRDRRVGRWVHYAIAPEGLAALERFLGELRQSAESAPGCSERCCE